MEVFVYGLFQDARISSILDEVSHPPFFTNQMCRALGAQPVTKRDVQAFANPPQEIQEQFVGGSFAGTYLEAASFLNYFFERVVPAGATPESLKGFKILDFGCGWGRMLRLIAESGFFKEAEVHGCDPAMNVLEICRQTIPSTWVTPCLTLPPTIYRDKAFDLIYAYSVFSHLNEHPNLAWAEEFARIMKPGGYICLTTQARDFIQICRDYKSGARKIESSWHTSLSRAFGEEDSFEKYDAGLLLCAPASDPYGEAVVPLAFFEQKWVPLGFEIVEWFEHPDAPLYGAQNRLILRRTV